MDRVSRSMPSSLVVQVALVAGGCLLLAVLAVLANNALRIRRAIKEFKRNSRGLPLMEKPNPVLGHLHKFATTRYLLDECVKLHRKYGKTFAWMYRDKVLVLTHDLELIKKVVLDQPNKHNTRGNFEVPLDEFQGSNILFAEDNQWRRLRRSVASALKSQKFKSPNVVCEIDDSIAKLIEGFEKRLGGKRVANIDVTDLLHRYSINQVYGSFYKQYNRVDFLADEDRITKWNEAAMASFRTNPLIALGVAFPVLKPIVTSLVLRFSPYGKWVDEVVNFVQIQLRQAQEARQRLEQLRNSTKDSDTSELDADNFTLADGTVFRRNLMDHVIDPYLDGKMSKEEFRNTTYIFFMAAEKTTSDTLINAVYNLAANSEVQEKLRASVFAEGVESEYLDWVISETLRLCPPIPGGVLRTLAEDVEVPDGSGQVVPKGSKFLTSLNVIHRLPEYWGPDADQFKPERWVHAKDFHPCQYLAFGAGSRYCPGRDFAMFTMKKLLCTLLTRYKFVSREKYPKLDVPFFLYVLFGGPINVEVSHLKSTCM